MYIISKDFSFSAAHALIDLPEEHQCSRFHGHNYMIRITLGSSAVDRRGFVRDYGELGTFKQWLDDMLDHRWLGYGDLARITDEDMSVGSQYEFRYAAKQRTKPAFDFNPTAENMAKHLYDFAATLYPEVVSIGVSETPKTWATYAPGTLTMQDLERAIETLPDPLRLEFRTALRRH